MSGSLSLDLDQFWVWSDDDYGDTDGDQMPDLPVSRIPCDTAGDFVRRALGASGHQVGFGLPGVPGRRGVRDSQLPFADQYYQALHALPDPDSPLVTPPHQNLQDSDVSADAMYFVLHQGETQPIAFTAVEPDGTGVTVLDIASFAGQTTIGAVVFSSCCWGALVSNRRALDPFEPQTLTPETSIGLSILNRGLVAYVGFTGSHWAPSTFPYRYWGGPLHEYFWRNWSQKEMPPARALFEAKAEYIANAPYLRLNNPFFDTLSTAIELKTFWSATCLGLGW
jgi:hypothetical protein